MRPSFCVVFYDAVGISNSSRDARYVTYLYDWLDLRLVSIHQRAYLATRPDDLKHPAQQYIRSPAVQMLILER